MADGEGYIPSIADTGFPGRGSDRTGELFIISSNHPADAVGSGLDVPVTDMRVAQGHLHLGVAEQTRHHRQRNSLHRRLAGKRVPEIVKAHILDTAQLPHPVPPIYLIRGASRTPTGPPALVMAPSSL